MVEPAPAGLRFVPIASFLVLLPQIVVQPFLCLQYLHHLAWRQVMLRCSPSQIFEYV